MSAWFVAVNVRGEKARNSGKGAVGSHGQQVVPGEMQTGNEQKNMGERIKG